MGDFRSLWPEYQKWVNDKTHSEDYYEAEMEWDDAVAEALWLQHMEEDALAREQAEEHYRKVAEAKRKELEEKFPGVIFPVMMYTKRKKSLEGKIMKVYKELLDCYSSKNELKFFSILSTLSDQEIDEILESGQDMPHKMRYILIEFEDQRNHYKNL